MSAELRKMLAENPTLPALLQQAFSDPAMSPTVFFQHIMGISSATLPSSVSPNYRGSHPRGRARGGRGQPRGRAANCRGRGHARFQNSTGEVLEAQHAPPPSQETVQVMHRFADLVTSILSEKRGLSSTAT